MSDEEEYDSERYDSEVDDEDEKVFESDAGKRAYHNLLERKRRDNIKDSFCQLRDVIPSFSKKKKVRASRVQILKKACDFIQHQPDLQNIQDETATLEEENKLLEKTLAELDEAIANNDLEAIARLQASLPKRRHFVDTEDTDSEDCDSSDDDCDSSPPQSSSPPRASAEPIRKKIKHSSQ